MFLILSLIKLRNFYFLFLWTFTIQKIGFHTRGLSCYQTMIYQNSRAKNSCDKAKQVRSLIIFLLSLLLRCFTFICDLQQRKEGLYAYLVIEPKLPRFPITFIWVKLHIFFYSYVHFWRELSNQATDFASLQFPILPFYFRTSNTIPLMQSLLSNVYLVKVAIITCFYLLFIYLFIIYFQFIYSWLIT